MKNNKYIGIFSAILLTLTGQSISGYGVELFASENGTVTFGKLPFEDDQSSGSEDIAGSGMIIDNGDNDSDVENNNESEIGNDSSNEIGGMIIQNDTVQSSATFPYSGEMYYSCMEEICELTQGIFLNRGAAAQIDGHPAIVASDDSLQDIAIICDESGNMMEARTSFSIDYYGESVSMADLYLEGNKMGMSLACMVTTSVYTEMGLTSEFADELSKLMDQLTEVTGFLASVLENGMDSVENGACVKEYEIDHYGKIVATLESQDTTITMCYHWLPIAA